MPFDPTPTVAPAESQSSGILATSAARADAGEIRGGGPDSPALSEVAGEASAEGAADDDSNWLLSVLLLLALTLGAGGALFVGLRVRKRRSLGPDELAAAQVAELRRALVRLGWDVPGHHHAAGARAQAAAGRRASCRRLRAARCAPTATSASGAPPGWASAARCAAS